jgi:hypothetical protein
MLEKLIMVIGLQLLTIVLLPFFNTGTMAVSFHKDGKVSLATPRSNIYIVTYSRVLFTMELYCTTKSQHTTVNCNQ